MEYVPVLITTLSRATYLKRLLDSLMKCKGIEKTEIFISVDYPPQKTYEEGYKQVLSLLKEYDFRNAKKVNIFVQEKNLGGSENYKFLEEKVIHSFYAAIVSEEDNEFSPNFLEYMNTCLMKYKDNNSIIAVCASNEMKYTYGDEKVMLMKAYAAYGAGIWTSKKTDMYKNGPSVLLNPEELSFARFFGLYKKNRVFFRQYVNGVLCSDNGLYWDENGELQWVDTLITIYMHMTNKYSIVPRVPKARTLGNDGMGTSRMVNIYDMSELDEMESFDITEIDNLKFHTDNYKLTEKYLIKSGIKSSCIVSWILVFLFLLFRRDRNKVIRLVRIIKKHRN